MRGTVLAAAVATVAIGAAWYRRWRARSQPPPKTPPPSAPCCAAKQAAVGAHAGTPLEPLCAQLVEHLRARLASPSPSASPSASQGAAAPARDHTTRHLSAASEAWLAAVLRLAQSDALPGEEGWRVALLVACAQKAQACLRGVWATMGAHLLASAREAARLEAAVQAGANPNPNPNANPNPNHGP